MKNKIPPPKNGQSSKYGFDALKKYGDFVFVAESEAEKAKVAAYKYAKYNGFKVAIRSIENGINVYHAGV